jgi:hypothetical protein
MGVRIYKVRRFANIWDEKFKVAKKKRRKANPDSEHPK